MKIYISANYNYNFFLQQTNYWKQMRTKSAQKTRSEDAHFFLISFYVTTDPDHDRSEYKAAQKLFSENIIETVDQHLSENFRKETICSA